jgi:CHAD domain-containing protein
MVRETVERELKLVPPDGFRLPELGGSRLPTRTFTSTYHDTGDHVLLRRGVTLRHRSESGAGLWQLKLPRGAARIELELAGPPARPPAELTRLLVAHLRGRELRPVARLRTRREGVLVDGAEVTQDAVAVLEGQRVVRRFHEIEVELVGGDEAGLARIEQELVAAGAMVSDLRPKVQQALELAPPPEPPAPTSDTAPRAALGLALAQQVERLLRHDPGTRLGADREDLHQLRVATRRLRAFLRAGRPLVARDWADGLREELGWLGSALGPARDLDVLEERLRLDAAELGQGRQAALASLLDTLERDRLAAREAAVEALESPRYLELLERLEGVSTPPAGTEEPPLASLWRSEWKRTRRAFKGLGDRSSDDALHASRIKVKRARYAAELAAHELGKPGRRFVEAARSLQDVLGEHQDAVVAEERILAWREAGGDPGVAAELVELERERRAGARATWRAAWHELRERADAVQA